MSRKEEKERTMKKTWRKIRRPVCGSVMFLCLLLLLGCTGTAEHGGDLVTYALQGVVLLIVAIAAGIVGGLFE